MSFYIGKAIYAMVKMPVYDVALRFVRNAKPGEFLGAAQERFVHKGKEYLAIDVLNGYDIDVVEFDGAKFTQDKTKLGDNKKDGSGFGIGGLNLFGSFGNWIVIIIILIIIMKKM